MSIKWFLYKIALKYIGWCNKKPSNITSDYLKKMDRLTYRNCYKAYLLYGADAEWCKFKNYEVLDNAVQRLAEYEDEDYIFRDSAFSNFVRCRVDASKDGGENNVNTNN